MRNRLEENSLPAGFELRSPIREAKPLSCGGAVVRDSVSRTQLPGSSPTEDKFFREAQLMVNSAIHPTLVDK